LALKAACVEVNSKYIVFGTMCGDLDVMAAVVNKFDGLISELETRSQSIRQMNFSTDDLDAPIIGDLLDFANVPEELDRLGRAVELLVGKAGMTLTDAETVVRQLLKDRNFYGSYSELGAYDWLDRHGATFQAQLSLSGEQVLNPNGCTIDGRFDGYETYFDVKGMGFQAYVAQKFLARLQKRLVGLEVTIDGNMDVSVKDIDEFAHKKIAELATSLGSVAVGCVGAEQIPELGWTIRVRPQRNVGQSMHTIDPYRLAAENRYYPFKGSGQFTKNVPFLLIFPYTARFNVWLSMNFMNSTVITFRAMARRIFMQLTTDTSLASAYDRQVDPLVTVGAAARLISGILFINLDNDFGRLFLNPQATHLLTRLNVQQLFNFEPTPDLDVDNFEHDSY
jgi:hypothetical protein